jgi:hypothetical protein
MRNKIYLPKSYEELDKMPYSKLEEYWKIFYLSPCRARASILRPLWYKIQCENLGIKLQDKYKTRLNKYARKDPAIAVQKANKIKYELKTGTELIKTYKDTEYKVIVIGPKEFEYKGQKYTTLSAVAKAICGLKVSGPDFFNLNNKY